MKSYNHEYIDNDALKEWLKSIDLKHTNSVLVQMFCGIDNKVLLKEISKTIKQNIPNVTIIGASTSGEILDGKMKDNSVSISLTTFFSTSLISSLFTGKDSFEMGKKVASSIIKDDTKAIIMFADGIQCNGELILKGFDTVTKSHIVISGGMAGDDNKFEKTFVLHNDEILEESVVAVSLNNPNLQVFNSYNLSWRPIGSSMKVTSAAGNVIKEINNKPVSEIYREYLGDDIVENLPDSAIEFPLIFRHNNVNVARSMIAYNGRDIVYAGEIPVGTEVKFGVASVNIFRNDKRELYATHVKLPIESIFVYSCTARKSFLGKDVERELIPLQSIAPVSGFFTYGELYTDERSYEMMNITTTVLSLSERDDISHTLNKKLFGTKRLSLSTSALIHLVERSILNLENESQEKQKTIATLNQYQKAINKSYIISQTDSKGIITDVNELFCKLSGYSREELVGKPHNIIRHPDMPASLFKKMWQTIQNNKIWRGEVKNLSKSNKTYYVDVTIFPLLDKDEKINGYVSIRNDITDIKLQRNKAEAILNSQDSIVLLSSKIDDKMSVKQLNKKFFDLFDFKDLDDFLSKHSCICDLFIKKEGYLQKVSNGLTWLELLLSEQDKSHLVLMADKNHQERVFSVKSKHIDLETESFIISTFTEVTELEKARVEAMVAEKTKGAFLATMSHELRTPLNAVIGFSQILMNKDDMPIESMKSFIEKIHISGKHLLDLVNNILDFSKIESQKMDLDKQELELNSLMLEAIMLVETVATKKKITIEKNNFQHRNINADKQLLKQVLLNILSNAIKFTPKNKKIRLRYEENNSFHIISICDEGIGLTQQQAITIFQPFSQIQEHQNEAIKGTGLGLAISKKIMELHNGKIDVVSEIGNGSCFNLYLPKEKD